MKLILNNRFLLFAVFFSFYSVVYARTLKLFNSPQITRKSHSVFGNNYKDSINYLIKVGEKFEQTYPDSAWFYFEKAYKLALLNNDKKSLSLFISNAIRLLNNEGKYEKALALGQKMISIGSEIQDTVILIKGLNDAANEFEYLGDLQQASENYIKALNLSEKLGNFKFQQKLNNNIASIYIELKDYPHAHIYANNAFKMDEITKNPAELGSSLINLGISEIHLKKYFSALEHFNRAISISRQVKDITLNFDAKLNRGIIFTKQNKLQQAWNDYESVHLKSEKLNMPDYNLYALFSLAGIYQLRHNYKKAAEMTKQAILIGKKMNAPNELQEMYDTLSVLSEKLGDPVNALKYRKAYEVLKDSISNAEVRDNINSLQIKYNAAQKDKQIAEQNLRIQENQSTIDKENILLIFSAIFIFILIILVIISYRFYMQKKLLHEQSIINFKKNRR